MFNVIFTHKTQDTIFYVLISDNLTNELKNNLLPYPQAKNLTIHKIHAFNTYTNQHSDKSIYLDKNNRLYFNGKKASCCNTKRYYIDELIKI